MGIKSYQFELSHYIEKDGVLVTFEPSSIQGFQVSRVFYIYGVPDGKERANHACMNSATVYIAISGSIKISVEADNEMKEYLLDNNSIAVFAPPASWIKAYDFSNDAVLIGLSDYKYADCQYINDYDRYKTILRGTIK